jgi:hypothetical protein
MFSSGESVMKSNTRLITTIGLIGLGFMMPLNMASAHSDFLQRLSAEWWQWALSIPVSENPILDTTGEKCVIGQRGSTWFLAGNAGGETTRTCSVPEGKALFFPIINSVNIDTPDVCGQGPERSPVEDLRALSATFIDGASDLLAEVDGEPIDDLRRIQSKVFVVALPEENVFDAPCAAFGGVPAGIYSPAVDDGFYVKLRPLEVGDHTLHFHAENLGDPSTTDDDFVFDVTYNLTVVPVVRE